MASPTLRLTCPLADQRCSICGVIATWIVDRHGVEELCDEHFEWMCANVKIMPPFWEIKKRPRSVRIPRERPSISTKVQRLLHCVEASTGIPTESLIAGTCTSSGYAMKRARQLACWLLRSSTGMPYTELARVFGVHHTTAIHGYESVVKRRREDKALLAQTEALLIAVMQKEAA